MNNFSFVINIPFSIAAGESLSLPAGSWSYFYLAELSGGDLMAEGQQFRLPLVLGRQVRVSEKEIGTILITNNGGTTATGVIYAGAGDIEDKATVGTVAVSNFPAAFSVDNQQSDSEALRALTITGSQMIGGSKVAGVSAKYGYIQIVNPAASGVVVYIKKFSTAVGASANNRMIKYGTALTTLATMGAFNDKSGAAAPKAEIRTDTLSSGTLGDLIGYISGGADVTSDWIKDAPVKLAEGEGLMIRTGTTNSEISAIIEWEEI